MRDPVEKLDAILNQVSGLDKAFKLIVYSSKLICCLPLQSASDEKYSLVKRLTNLVGPLSDTRMAMRLFGLLYYVPILKSYAQQSSTIFKDNSPEKISQHLKVLSMLVYYPSEHIYWFGAHQVLKIQDPDSWSRVSCRAWAVYIILDIFDNLKLYRQKVNEAKVLKSQINNGSGKAELSNIKRDLYDLKVKLMGCVADLPMAIHWSLASYPLPQWLIAVCGITSAICSSSLKWKYFE